MLAWPGWRRRALLNGAVGLASVFNLDRAILPASLVAIAASVAIGATMVPARAQQYFNGSQTTPNGLINGGGGVWNNTTTNWTDDPGTASNPYDPSAGTTTLFGASTTSTPPTAGIVTVAPGGVQLTGAVIFDATGDNSVYTIQGGNLTVAAGGTTFTVNDVSLTTDPSAVITSSIVGTGALNLQGIGKLLLAGANTYSGGTTICACATLQLGDATRIGSIIGAVVNEGFFNIVNANTAGITSITNDGGQTTFFNASTAGTATIVNDFGGTTVFNDSSSALNANITNTAFGGSTLFYGNSSAGSAIINNESSAGSIEPVGLGFFDNSRAATATITNSNGGYISFGIPAFLGGTDTASADHATIINNSGGLLDFNASTTAGHATIITNSGGGTAFFDNSNGGNAQFITNGTGYVDFSDTIGLGPVGPLGLNRITAGSIAGSGTYSIGSGNVLTVGSNNLSTEVSGVIDDGCGCGSGSLEKVGTGTLTLSGTNTYTGLTFVNAGTLLVTGSIASSTGVSVDSGATLGGTGTVPFTTLANGAVLAPGLPTALGTLTVNDALLFCNCTFYDVKVTSGGNDLTVVVPNSLAGFASLEGAVRVISLDNTYRFNSPYTILTAQGGFDLGFGPTLFNSLVVPTGINGVLSYTATDVNLTLVSALGHITGLNINQRNVGNALDAVFNATGNSGNLGAIFNGNVPFNLSQVSGETATGTQQATFDAMNLFLGLLTDPFIDGRRGASPGGATPFADEGGASAYAARKQNAVRAAFAKFPTKADVARNDLFDPRWSLWGSAFGGSSTTSGNAALGSNDATTRAFGFAAGADYRISPATLAGFALAGGGTHFAVNGFGSGRSDMFQAGAFVRHTMGKAYVTGALAYGWQDVTTDRTVTVAGIDRLRAQFNANAWSGRVEGGYRFVTPWMGVTPYAAGQFTTYQLPGYAEQVVSGANTFALNYAARDVTASRSELGIRTDKSFAMQTAILTLRGRAAWAHNFNTDRSITPVFQTLPGAAFVVNGAAQARDAALTTASAEMKWLNGWSAAATFEGEFSHVTRSYAGKGVARYTW